MSPAPHPSPFPAIDSAYVEYVGELVDQINKLCKNNPDLTTAQAINEFRTVLTKRNIQRLRIYESEQAGKLETILYDAQLALIQSSMQTQQLYLKMHGLPTEGLLDQHVRYRLWLTGIDLPSFKKTIAKDGMDPKRIAQSVIEQPVITTVHPYTTLVEDFAGTVITEDELTKRQLEFARQLRDNEMVITSSRHSVEIDSSAFYPKQKRNQRGFFSIRREEAVNPIAIIEGRLKRAGQYLTEGSLRKYAERTGSRDSIADILAIRDISDCRVQPYTIANILMTYGIPPEDWHGLIHVHGFTDAETAISSILDPIRVDLKSLGRKNSTRNEIESKLEYLTRALIKTRARDPYPTIIFEKERPPKGKPVLVPPKFELMLPPNGVGFPPNLVISCDFYTDKVFAQYTGLKGLDHTEYYAKHLIHVMTTMPHREVAVYHHLAGLEKNKPGLLVPDQIELARLLVQERLNFESKK